MLKGLAASVIASFFYLVRCLLAPWLAPLDGEQVFGWRILSTLPFTTALLLLRGQWPQVQALLLHARQEPLWGLGLLASAALLGVQLWLFLWAPLHGRALPVSLGYFLLPLVMVLAGRLLFGEQLTRLQWLATVLAALGVLHEIWRAGRVLGNLARSARLHAVFCAAPAHAPTILGGHWLDMMLLIPAALWFVLRTPPSFNALAQHPNL